MNIELIIYRDNTEKYMYTRIFSRMSTCSFLLELVICFYVVLLYYDILSYIYLSVDTDGKNKAYKH